jgi:hypothetical protein
MNNCPSPRIIEAHKDYIPIEIEVVAWDWHGLYCVKLVNRIPIPNTIIIANNNTDINNNTKPSHICFHSRRSHAITNLN